MSVELLHGLWVNYNPERGRSDHNATEETRINIGDGAVINAEVIIFYYFSLNEYA